MDDSLHKDALSLAADVAWIRGLARKLVRDDHLADDITQDALLARLRRGPHVQGGWKPWISGVVRNLAHNAQRRARRQALAPWPAEEPTSRRGSAQSALLVERQRLLAGCVLELGDPYREVVLLRFYERLPQRAIARRLQIPVSTVNTRLRRALEKLRRRLDGEFGGDGRGWLGALAPLTLKPPVALTSLTLGGLAMNTKLLAAGLMVALCLGGFLIYGRDEQPQEQTTSPTREAPLVAQPRASAAAAIETAPFVPGHRSLPKAPQGRLITVQVVSAPTGAAVSGAQVFVVHDQKLASDVALREKLAAARVEKRTPRELFQQFGEQHAADAEGVAGFHVEGAASVMALTESADAWGHVDSKVRELTLRLRPRRSLVVRVVDGQGRPLTGIPVGVTATEQRQERLLAYTRTSGAAGSTELLISETTMGGDPLRQSQAMFVGLHFPLKDPVRLRIDPRDWPTEPLTLVCPAVGSVEVLVRGSAGADVRDGILVQLLAGTRHEVLTHFNSRQDDLAAWTRGSRVVLAPVGLGLDLTVLASARARRARKSIQAKGPQHEGQRTLVVLSMAGRHLKLHGRLRHPDDAPMARKLITISLEQADPLGRRSELVTTGADGSFALDWFEYEGEPLGGRLTIGALPSIKPWDARCSVTLEGTLSPRGADWDLGDLTIPRPQPLVAGTVVRPDGSPVAGVTVRFAYKQQRPGQEPSFIRISPSEPTGENGRFEMWSRLQEGDSYLVVMCQGPWHHDPVPFDVGQKDVQLVIKPWGDLSGRVLLEEGLPHPRLQIGIWPHANNAKRRWGIMGWRYALPQVGSRFRFDDLAPGDYDLGVGTGISEQSVVYVSGIHVAAGVATHDQRLEPLDLRGKFQSFEVVAVNRRGVPLDASVYAFSAGARGVAQLGTSRKPQLIRADQDLQAILIEADGYFPLILEPFSGRRRVTLSRGLPVVVAPADHSPVPNQKGVRLHVRLERDVQAVPAVGGRRAARFRRDRGPAAGFFKAASARLDLRVPEAGTYRLVLKLWWESRGYVLWEPLTLSAGRTLVVPADSPTPEHQLQWSPEEFARALAALRRRIKKLAR